MSQASPLSFLSVDLAGLKVSAEPEVTKNAVVDTYNAQLQPILDTLSKQNDNLTPAQLEGDAAAMQAAITELINTGKNGIVVSIDATDPNAKKIPYYYTQQMATQLNDLFETLQIAGATIDASSGTPVVKITGEEVRRWLDFSLISPVVGQIANAAEQSTQTATRTLQSMIELEYVKTANDVLSEHMTSLEEALSSTKQILSTLGDVQSLHNQIGIVGAGSFNFPLSGSGLSTSSSDRQAYKASYISAASSFFGTAISPSALTSSTFPSTAPSGQTVESLRQQGIALVSQLNADLSQLIPIAGSNSDLVKNVETVRNELQTAITNQSSFQLWLTDNYGASGTAISAESGRVQQNISYAISSGQALNDSQSQEVSRFMFVFEEYYKSASSLLTKISQIIEQVAQGISR